MDTLPINNMIRLCHIDECVENYCKSFTLNRNGTEVDVFIVCKNGNIHVYQNQCPHTNGPIDWGNDQFLSLDKDYIQCAQHGALFNIQDGECIYGPCLAETLSVIPVQIENDWVCVNI